MPSVTDYYLVYRFVKALVTPFKKTKAFKLGIIDENGNILKKMKDLETPAEKQAYGRFERMIWNLKKVLQKVPFLSKNFVSIAAASLLLFKEEKEYEFTYAKYLMEDIEFLNDELSLTTLKHLENYINKLVLNKESVDYFFEEVNRNRIDRKITNSDIICLFKRTLGQCDIVFSDSDVQSVILEMETNINMPFLLLSDEEDGGINLVAKTVIRKRGFKSAEQKLRLEDMPVTNATSGNFAGLPPDDPPVSKKAQKKHRKRNKKKRKKFSEYVSREILNVK